VPAATGTSRCLKCRRPLRRPSPDGYGPTCRTKVRRATRARAVRQYKPHLVAKAEELIELGAAVPLRGNRVFLIPSSDGSEVYRAHRAACTCKAGIRGEHVCAHRIAAHILALAA